MEERGAAFVFPFPHRYITGGFLLRDSLRRES